jgi:hypothetical protein
VQTGTKISVAAHTVLVGWALFGAVFDSEPFPFEVQEVSVISAQDFEKLSAQTAGPVVSPEPAALPQPEPTPDAPDVAARPDPEPDRTPPETTSQPEPEVTPVPPQAEETPEPDTSDAPAPLVTPELETAEVSPVVTPRPKPRQTDRVAPTPVAPPPQDTKPDDVAQLEIADAEGAQSAQETQDATAPEAANDRTVTEADQQDSEEVIASAAPSRSLRPPRNRPTRPVPAAQPAPETDAVADAIAEALAGQSGGGAETQAEVPSGPPLTDGEKDALRVSVSNCWNVGSLSTEALKTTVVVAVSLSQEGKPDSGSVRMLSSSGGSAGAADQAFQAARRAIIRCGSKGFDLPAEKYGQWRDIEMTFNPERMRIK